MHYKYKSKPFAHQKKALEMSWDKEVFAYFMEMGTGKSKVLIDNIAMLYNAGKINGALIVAPKGVYKNWFDQEIPTFQGCSDLGLTMRADLLQLSQIARDTCLQGKH